LVSLRLVVVQGPATGLHVGLEGRAAFTVGSSPMADLTLHDPALAAVHLRFLRGPLGYTVVDLSKRGFAFRGQRVGRADLVAGDAVGAGSHVLKLISDARRSTAAPPAPPPPAPVAAPQPPGPALEALEGNDVGKRFSLAGRSILIVGRGAEADVTLWDIRASRAHCRLDLQRGAWLLSDLNSSNGTYVNGARLQGTRQLMPGDLIQIGSTVLLFQP
jgi:hypothetical protein